MEDITLQKQLKTKMIRLSKELKDLKKARSTLESNVENKETLILISDLIEEIENSLKEAQNTLDQLSL